MQTDFAILENHDENLNRAAWRGHVEEARVKARTAIAIGNIARAVGLDIADALSDALAEQLAEHDYEEFANDLYDIQEDAFAEITGKSRSERDAERRAFVAKLSNRKTPRNLGTEAA